MEVIKRDGRREQLDLKKFHDMVAEACSGLTGVSASQIEMSSGIQFFDGITTRDIQSILIKSAADLISLETPNYQYAAARLLLFGLYKDVFGQFEPVSLLETIKLNIDRKIYDPQILEFYTEEEINTLNSFVKFERDFQFTYAGLRQVYDKYLVQDRSSGQIFEVPQYMYIMISATLFANYPKNTRMKYVKKYYDAISTFRINIPTPVMSGVRTLIRQFASCVLVDSDDTLDSIFSSSAAIGKYTAQRAGIGINFGRIRGINSKIRGGEVLHTGVIPFLKVFESVVRSTSQNGIRGGSATAYVPIWHQEIEDILVLKNNKGSEDNRVRKLDYGIQLSKIFYERILKNQPITLFSPHDVPGLYEAFGTENFDRLYINYEKNKSIPKKQVDSMTLFTSLLKERAETGRIYIMNIDHANSHSSFLDIIHMSNLCAEITLPTTPIQSMDGDGEIATCILSAVNLGLIKSLDELEELCDLAVRALEEIIDYQTYPVKAAEYATKKRRSLGVGYIGLAHYLAKNHLKYEEPDAWKLMEETTEAFQYYLIKASLELAKEKGPCEYFNRTKYSKGILPIDTYKSDVDDIVPHNPKLDWEELRNDILVHGLRHSTLSAQMPSESSSIVSNATNGIEPPRDFISVKKSKKGPLKQVVPGYGHLKNYYTLLWEMDSMDGYLKTMAVIQKYFDQAMSINTSYNPSKFDNNEVPMSILIKDILNGYKWGTKNFYYHNTNDGMKDEDVLSKETQVILDRAIKRSELDDYINNEEEEDCESCKI